MRKVGLHREVVSHAESRAMSGPMELLRGRSGRGSATTTAALKDALARPGVDVNAADPQTGYTALHYACKLRDPQAVALLTKAPGLDPNKRDTKDCLTPLFTLLTVLGQDGEHLSSEFAALVEAARGLAGHPRAKLGQLSTQGISALSLVLEISHKLGTLYRERRLFEEIVGSTSGDIPVRAQNERTALMVCVQLGNPRLLEKLLQYQRPALDLYAVDGNRMTVLHIAGKLGRWDCGELLVRKDPALCDIKDDNGNTALFYFVVKLQPARECLNFLSNSFNTCWDFKAVNSLGENILDYYDRFVDKSIRSSIVQDALWVHSGVNQTKGRKIRKHNPSVSRVPLGPITPVESGTLATVRDSDKSLRSHMEGVRAVERLFMEVARESGGTLDSLNSSGYTALMSTCMHGLEEETELLLQARPNLSLTNRRGETVLHLAAIHRRVGVAQLICKQPTINNIVNAQDQWGMTPLFYILEKFPSKDVTVFLGDQHLRWDFRVKSKSMYMPGDYFMYCLEHHKCQVNERDGERMIEKLRSWRSIRRQEEAQLQLHPRTPEEHEESPDTLYLEDPPSESQSDNSARSSRSSRSSNLSTSSNMSFDRESEHSSDTSPSLAQTDTGRKQIHTGGDAKHPTQVSESNNVSRSKTMPSRQVSEELPGSPHRPTSQTNKEPDCSKSKRQAASFDSDA